MNTFVNNFIKVGKARVSEELHGSLSNAFSSLSEPLLKLRRSLNESQPRYDSLILAFSHTPDLISDAAVELGGIATDTGHDFVQISSDAANLLVNGVTDAITNNGDELTSGLTVTDAKGYAYNIVKTNTSIDDNTVIIASRSVVDSIDQAILYTDQSGKYYFNNLIQTVEYDQSLGKGGLSSIWSVLTDLMESTSLNQAILMVTDALVSSVNFAGDFFQSVSEKVGDKFSSVKTFIADARAAWISGGYRGLASYVIGYVKGAASLTQSDGLITFSDNTKLVPQQYIAGIVFQVLSTVTSLLGVIVASFSKILGGILIVGGQIFKGIFNSISYDKQGTYASMVLKDSVLLPMSPYALWQFECYSAQVDDVTLSIFSQGAELAYVEVPGGFIIIGPSSVNDQATDDSSITQKYPTFIYKFYPSIINHDRDGRLSDILKNNFLNNLFSYNLSSNPLVGDTANVIFDGTAIRTKLLSIGKDTEWIMDQYALAGADTVYLNSQDSEALIKGDQDLLLQRSIAGNIVWFMLWFYSMVPSNEFLPLGSIYLTCKVSNVQWAYDEQQNPYISDFEVTVDGTEESSLIPFIFHEHFNSNMVLRGTGWLADAVCTIKYTGYPGWTKLGQYAVNNGGSVNLSEFITGAINYGDVIDYPVSLPSRVDFAMQVPKYDAKTFNLWLVLSIVVAVVATAAVISLTVTAKKAINRRRAINQASVEAAWSNLASNPTAENYAAYRKTVKKNNRWATFIGGTRYDYQNYWNGDVSASDSSSPVQGGLASSFDYKSGSSTDDLSVDNSISLDTLKTLIAG